MSETKILHCHCKHEYQDERYGEGRRVHNYGISAGTGTSSGWRCTVCTDVKRDG